MMSASSCPLLLLCLLGFAVLPLQSEAAAASAGKGTISKVIKLLEEMMEKNQEEVKADKEMFAKFKCYCDSNEEEKKASIEKLTNEIALAEAKLQDLQASSGKLSVEAASLEKELAANELSREQAKKMREEAHETFLQEESDMIAAIASMDAALDVLSGLSAEGLKKGAAFMTQAQKKGTSSSSSLSAAQASSEETTRKKEAALRTLMATAPLLPPPQRAKVQALLQGHKNNAAKEDPKGIAGILKSMRDTFEEGMKTAKAAEEAAAKAHEEFLATKEDEHGVLSDSLEGKKDRLGENDESLGTTQESLETAQGTLEEDQAFLEELLADCEEKAKLYEERKAVRADEQAALSEALAILNSDAAFDTFGKVGATKKGRGGGAAAAAGASFLQLLRTTSGASSSPRAELEAFLQERARSLKSSRVGEVALALLRAGKENPLNKVLDKIDSVIKLIEKEEQADEDNKAWCDTETGNNEEMLETKTTAVEGLKDDITTLKEDIEETKGTIADTEASLEENRASQTELKDTRAEEHAIFQETVKNTADATDVLEKAIHALKSFYAEKAKAELVARREEVRLGLASPTEEGHQGGAVEKVADKLGLMKILDKATFPHRTKKPVAALAAAAKSSKKEDPPEIFEDAEVKQSDSGTKVIEMLEYILKETETEEKDARDEEEKAQEEFDKEMEELTKSEETLLEELAEAKNSLAESEETLGEKKLDLIKTEKDKAAIEKYIGKIKPGCDFITENIEERKKKRAEETKALETAKEKIKGTPAYKKFEEEAAEKK